MGGAYADTTERFDREKHDQLFSMVKEAFDHIELVCNVIPFLDSKEDFGDVDTVISVDRVIDVDECVEEVKGYLETVYGEHTVEVDSGPDDAPHYRVIIIDGYQVDVNFIDQSRSEIYRMFFAYNGLNIILNKILTNNHIRLSLTEGLKINLNKLYEINGPNDFYHYIPIENVEMKDVIELAKLDYKRYSKGFNDFDEIYEWFEQSPCYEPKVLNKYNLNAKKRREIRNNRIMHIGYERYSDEDFEKEPKPITFDRLVRFIDDRFPRTFTHLIIMDNKVREFKIERDIKRVHRETKNFIIEKLRDMYRPEMSKKEFNYKYIRELYKYNHLTIDDSIQKIIETVAKQFHD